MRKWHRLYSLFGKLAHKSTNIFLFMQYYCAWFLFFAFLFVTELFVKLCFVVSNDFFC